MGSRSQALAPTPSRRAMSVDWPARCHRQRGRVGANRECRNTPGRWPIRLRQAVRPGWGAPAPAP
jgi:hypothetical protein